MNEIKRKMKVDRCIAVSPMRKFQCEKPADHISTEQNPVHKSEFIIWKNEVGATEVRVEDFEDAQAWGKKFRELLDQDFIRILKDVVPAEQVSDLSKRQPGGLLASPGWPMPANRSAGGPPEENSYSLLNLGKTPSVTFNGDDITDMTNEVKLGGATLYTNSEGEPTFDELETAGAAMALREWWLGLAEQEADRTIPKAVEYSSTDLEDIGRDLARITGQDDISAEEAAELGVYFYLRGKLSRWTGALMNGERPSDDTLFDIGVYVRMAQRIRAVGSWPGVNL